MSNFSIENIGAFELNRASVLLSDGALETTAQNPGPVTGRGWTGACCGRVDDGALEASAGPGPGSITLFPRCSRIDADAN